MIVNTYIHPAALDLLEEATKRGIYIECAKDQTLHTSASLEVMSQEDLEEFTRRLDGYVDEVTSIIDLFGEAERNGVH